MSRMPDLLNHIASSPSKRKKLHEVDNTEIFDEDSSAGLNYQNDGEIAIGNETSRKRARLSRSTLSKPSDSTLQNVGRTNRTYDVPNSPERTIESPRRKPRLQKTKKTRVVNRPKLPQKSPLKGTGHGAIGLVPGVCLTSYNTPARPDRARGAQKGRNALNPLRPAPRQFNPANQDDQADSIEVQVERTRPSDAEEAGNVILDEQDQVELDDHARQSPDDTAPSSRRITQDHRPSDHQVQPPNGENVNDLPDDDDELSAEIQRQHSRKPRSGRDGGIAQSRTLGNAARVNGRMDGEGGEHQSTAAQSQSQRSRRRQPQSEEERLARREAQARRWAENAEATERAETTLSAKRGEKFLDGIDAVIQQARIGSVDLWSSLGSAAMAISAMVEKKSQMDTTRAEALNKTLRDLKALFTEDCEDANAGIETCLRRLKQRASRLHLKGVEEPARGDPTVVNLFEHLIPHSIRLIRHYLRTRFDKQNKHSWRELQILVRASRDMSDVALKWTPKPSILEAGIRGNVFNKIRPSLSTILQQISERLNEIEAAEQFESTRRKAEKAQYVLRQQRIRFRLQCEDELEERMCLIGRSTAQPKPRGRTSFFDESIDIDDIDDHESEPREMEFQSRNSQLFAPWSDVEDIALLNGLEKHQTGARFWLVRNENPQLKGRAIDECITRAVYYKRKLCQIGKVVHWLQDIHS